MSNREIIEWLKKKAEAVPMPGARKMYEAAAKALEAQKYMISRQAVLDALNNIEIPRNASWYQYYQQALTAVEKLPPAPTTEVATDNNVGTKVSTNLAEVGTDLPDNNVGELISRQAAIDALCKAGCGSGYCGISCDDVKAIEQLPSAQPEQHWIPCGERLPEDNSDILITYVEKDEKRIAPVNYGCGTWFDCLFNKVLDQVGVLAWMPLPKPYKTESEDKE